MATIGTALLVLAADQASKFWVRSSFAEEEVLVVIRGCFNITFVRNRGGVFGIYPGHQFLFLVFSIATVLAIGLLYRRYAPGGRAGRTAVGMILGGAIGNLADRLLADGDGCVTDWLDLYIGRHHWPAFNVADAAITAGVAILVYLLILRPDVPRGGEGGP